MSNQDVTFHGSDVRGGKVCNAKRKYITSEDSDKSLDTSCGRLSSGDSPQSKRYLKAIDFYQQIAEDKRTQANISFYLLTASIAAGMLIIALSLLLAWKYGPMAGSLIVALGTTITSYVLKISLKTFTITLEELKGFCCPRFKETVSEIENALEELPDSDEKERIRLSLIQVLLSSLRETTLPSAD